MCGGAAVNIYTFWGASEDWLQVSVCMENKQV